VRRGKRLVRAVCVNGRRLGGSLIQGYDRLASIDVTSIQAQGKSVGGQNESLSFADQTAAARLKNRR
jgi:hypothetical protein